MHNSSLSFAALTFLSAACLAQPSAGNSAWQIARKFIRPSEFNSISYTPGVLAGDTLYISGA